jgi:hypothetical protein
MYGHPKCYHLSFSCKFVNVFIWVILSIIHVIQNVLKTYI